MAMNRYRARLEILGPHIGMQRLADAMDKSGVRIADLASHVSTTDELSEDGLADLVAKHNSDVANGMWNR